MTARRPLRIASAGSTLFGARAAAAGHSGLNGAAEIAISTDHGHLLLERARNGQLDADIIILPSDMILDLAARGLADASNVVELGSVTIGAAVRQGALVPSVATTEDIKTTLLVAPEIVLTQAPTGEHLMRVIDHLGIMDNVKEKLKRFDKSVHVNAYLLDQPPGPLAFGPATEIIAWADRGIVWCGPIAQPHQVALPYSAACLTGSSNKNAARDFLEFLKSALARACFAATGVTTSG